MNLRLHLLRLTIYHDWVLWIYVVLSCGSHCLILIVTFFKYINMNWTIDMIYYYCIIYMYIYMDMYIYIQHTYYIDFNIVQCTNMDVHIIYTYYGIIFIMWPQFRNIAFVFTGNSSLNPQVMTGSMLNSWRAYHIIYIVLYIHTYHIYISDIYQIYIILYIHIYDTYHMYPYIYVISSYSMIMDKVPVGPGRDMAPGGPTSALKDEDLIQRAAAHARRPARRHRLRHYLGA